MEKLFKPISQNTVNTFSFSLSINLLGVRKE